MNACPTRIARQHVPCNRIATFGGRPVNPITPSRLFGPQRLPKRWRNSNTAFFHIHGGNQTRTNHQTGT